MIKNAHLISLAQIKILLVPPLILEVFFTDEDEVLKEH